MVKIAVPEGQVFIPRRRGVNVALELMNAVAQVKGDRESVRVVEGGYHVPADVAEAYAAGNPAVELEEGPDASGTELGSNPTIAEIEAFAAKQDPPIEVPEGKKAEKLQAVLDELAKRQPE